MPFDLENINQLSNALGQYFFLPFYETLHQTAKTNRFIKLTGPFIGTIDGIASLSQAVGGIGDAAIKGLANILKGSATCNQTSIKKGALQLVLGTSCIAIFAIPHIFVKTLRISINMSIDPISTSNREVEDYQKSLHNLSCNLS